MPPKSLPDSTLNAISIRCAGQYSFACYYSKTSIAFVVADKKNLEVLVRKVSGIQNMAEPILAQQPVRSAENRREFKLRVLHDPWRGEPG